MALKDVLKKFKTQASALGMSEDQYYERATRLAQTGDTTDLDAIRAQAVTDADTAAITEIDISLTSASTVASSAPADTDALSEGATNKYYTEGRVSANASVAANTAKKEGNGTVVIGLVAEAGVDYVFTGTASYASAVADTKVAKGGVVQFQPGTYIFDTIPSWKDGVIHRGTGLDSILELPAGQSNGAGGSNFYTFEFMLIRPVSGTHEMRFTDPCHTVLRHVQTDGDLRWEPQSNSYRQIIEDCSLGYNAAPTKMDWSGAYLYIRDSWCGWTADVNSGSGIYMLNCDSLRLNCVGAGNCTTVHINNCTAVNLTNSGTGHILNARIQGSQVGNVTAGNTYIPAGNALGTSSNFFDQGDQGVNFSINWAQVTGKTKSVRLTASVAITSIFGNEKGEPVYLEIVQDGVGSKTITSWPGTIVWLGGSPPVLKTDPAAVDMIQFIWDGTNYFGTHLGQSGGGWPAMTDFTMALGGFGGTAPTLDTTAVFNHASYAVNGKRAKIRWSYKEAASGGDGTPGTAFYYTVPMPAGLVIAGTADAYHAGGALFTGPSVTGVFGIVYAAPVINSLLINILTGFSIPGPFSASTNPVGSQIEMYFEADFEIE